MRILNCRERLCERIPNRQNSFKFRCVTVSSGVIRNLAFRIGICDERRWAGGCARERALASSLFTFLLHAYSLVFLKKHLQSYKFRCWMFCTRFFFATVRIQKLSQPAIRQRYRTLFNSKWIKWNFLQMSINASKFHFRRRKLISLYFSCDFIQSKRLC